MRWIGIGAVIAVLAIAAAGCGGSDDSGEAVADTVATETSASTDTTASTEETSTEETSTEETSTSTTGTSGLTDECKDLAKAAEKFSAASASATSGGDSDLEATASAYAELANEAPDELKDDFAALAEVMTTYAKALGDLDLEPGSTPNAEQIAKLVQLGQSLGTAKVQKASAAIAAWTTANCSATP